MNSGLSGYLDVVRIGAAFEVFLYHLGYHGLGHALPGFAWGHQAVIVFFVISGYVIAYVTNEREPTFSASRSPARHASIRLSSRHCCSRRRSKSFCYIARGSRSTLITSWHNRGNICPCFLFSARIGGSSTRTRFQTCPIGR